MKIAQRIAACVGIPIALFMLIFRVAPVSAEKQAELEKKNEEQIQELEDNFVPVVRFAVASDTHLRNASDTLFAERLAQLFQTAYRYADAQPEYKSLDAVLLAGDIVDNGSDDQYAELAKVVKENKRDETEFVTVMGNHEFSDGGREGYIRNMQGVDINAEPDKHVVIKGFHIIGLSPKPAGTWHLPSQWFWLNKQLKEASKDDPEKPIFTMQHGHIWNTVYVSKSWKTEVSLPLHAIYSQYPQVINFSGHSHGPINNPNSVWQNNYTLFGTGTLKYFEMEDDFSDDTTPEGCEQAAQYYIVEVDAENHVRLQPFNILTNDFFKTPSTTDDPDKQLVYYIDRPADKSSYVYTASRRKTDTPPVFPEDAKVTVSDITSTGAKVTFDRADADVCVYGYKIVIKNAENGKTAAKKELYAEYYFEPAPQTQSWTFDDLKAGTNYTVTVTPVNVWKAAGEPISADFSTP